MRKLFLPVTQGLTDRLVTPTVIAMRKRLGGRVGDDAAGPLAVGAEVRLRGGGEEPAARAGVVLYADGAAVDVYLDRGLVRRTRPSEVEPTSAGLSPELAAIGAQARVFGALREGASVRVTERDGAGFPATLREKCRYGALVETEAGAIVGVGFQRLAPA